MALADQPEESRTVTSDVLVLNIPQPILDVIAIIVGAWAVVFVTAAMIAVVSNDPAKRADARKVMRMIGAPYRMIASLARPDEPEQ